MAQLTNDPVPEESRSRGKTMRDALDELLARDYHDQAGNVLDGTSALVAKAFKSAMDGDLDAFRVIESLSRQDDLNRIGGPQDYC